MDAERALKRLSLVAAAFFALVITLAVVTAPDGNDSSRRTRPSPAAGYTYDELQRAVNMTQQMSTPNANTGSQYHSGDEQLQRSLTDPGYVPALEQYQADIDRMLGRGTP